MKKLQMHVPTYNGRAFSVEVDRDSKPEFGDPYMPVVVHPADGVRVVLGTHDCFDEKAPDIQIERRPRGWAIFLHPEGGVDPSGYVYFLDDGRSFVVPGRELSTTCPLVALNWDDSVAEVDGAKEARSEDDEACEFCGLRLTSSGDEWDGLCATCADLVSAYLDCSGLCDEDRDSAVAFLKTGPRGANERPQR